MSKSINQHFAEWLNRLPPAVLQADLPYPLAVRYGPTTTADSGIVAVCDYRSARARKLAGKLKSRYRDRWPAGATIRVSSPAGVSAVAAVAGKSKADRSRWLAFAKDTLAGLASSAEGGFERSNLAVEADLVQAAGVFGTVIGTEPERGELHSAALELLEPVRRSVRNDRVRDCNRNLIDNIRHAARKGYATASVMLPGLWETTDAAVGEIGKPVDFDTLPLEVAVRKANAREQQRVRLGRGNKRIAEVLSRLAAYDWPRVRGTVAF